MNLYQFIITCNNEVRCTSLGLREDAEQWRDTIVSELEEALDPDLHHTIVVTENQISMGELEVNIEDVATIVMDTRDAFNDFLSDKKPFDILDCVDNNDIEDYLKKEGYYVQGDIESALADLEFEFEASKSANPGAIHSTYFVDALNALKKYAEGHGWLKAYYLLEEAK